MNAESAKAAEKKMLGVPGVLGVPAFGGMK
jgi:hypothetical protein